MSLVLEAEDYFFPQTYLPQTRVRNYHKDIYK